MMNSEDAAKAISFIKRALCDSYTKTNDYSLLISIAAEIIANIHSCNLMGIVVKYDGIHMQFECSSMNIDKNDIIKATAYSIKNILLQNQYGRISPPIPVFPNEVKEFLNYENLECLFNVLYLRGTSFTIIL